MAFDHAPLRIAPGKATMHRGVLYRSRLAAQWAAFLDALRIAHVHEPQTFAVSPGVYFAPTFWLPQLKVWLEVKPADVDTREADRATIAAFAKQHPDTRVWVTSGAPRPGDWHVEQLAGAGRPIARGLLLADAGRPGDLVWMCGTNDQASEHLVFDPIDIGRPNHAPGFGGSRPADPNSDSAMRIAYAHADKAGGEDSEETWVSLGALARHRAVESRGRGAMAGRGG
jgi:hypothetical protein